MDVNRIFKGFPKTPAQTNYDHPLRPPSIWKTRLEKFMYKADKAVGRRRLLMYMLIVLVIIAVVGLAGTLFFSARTKFDGKQVDQVATAQANKIATVRANQTATAQAYPYPAYPSYLSGSGTLAFADSLSLAWQNESGCQFIDGAYHVSQQKRPYFNHCDASGQFSNFAFEVQMTIIRGDCGGMVFRSDGNWRYYYFHICRDGTYKVARFLNLNDTGTDLLSNQSSFINTGLGRQNKIAVVANGSTMTFYANGQSIGSKSDSNYTSGSIGLIANPLFNDATEVAYTNARIWTL